MILRIVIRYQKFTRRVVGISIYNTIKYFHCEKKKSVEVYNKIGIDSTMLTVQRTDSSVWNEIVGHKFNFCIQDLPRHNLVLIGTYYIKIQYSHILVSCRGVSNFFEQEKNYKLIRYREETIYTLRVHLRVQKNEVSSWTVNVNSSMTANFLL